VRRLDDELGVKGVHPVYRDQLEYRADVGGGLIEHEVVELFVASASAQTLQIALNPEEVAEVRWIDIYALADEVVHNPEAYTPWLRIYLRDYINLVVADYDSTAHACE
jgi:isopentenyl-diphosphate delta-isomerase